MSTLPDLSTWYLVPVGVTIPKGTPFAYTYNGINITVDLHGYRYDTTVDQGNCPHYTEYPIGPLLPTEEGAMILVSRDLCSPHILLTRKAGDWVDHYGVRWYVDEITSWAPVTVGETVMIR